MAHDPDFINVLLVEDNAGDARLVREAMRDVGRHESASPAPAFALTVVADLASALEPLDGGGVDVVLLDLGLPDSQGYATFERLVARAQDCAIVVLTQSPDDSLGARAVREGAQDYLTKSQFDGHSLVRSLRYASARKQSERDRSALLRAEVAVAEASEAQFRAIADSMPQLVWRASPEGAHDYENERWYEFTGAARLPDGGDRWLDHVHEDDRERTRLRWTEAVRRGGPFDAEYRLRRHDGVYRWFLGRALPLRDASGGVLMWCGTCTDIDDQKRADRSLALLAEAGAVLTAPFDAAATLRRFARMIVPRLADWTSVWLEEGDTISLAATVHVDPTKEAILRRAFERYGPTADGSPGYLAVVRTGSAELIPETSLAAARDAEHLAMLETLGAESVMTVPLTVAGRTIGALSLASSQTGRRYGDGDLRLAKELGGRLALALDSARLFELTQRERRRAEEANRTKDEFLSIASHELRTPLTAILGWSSLLRSGSIPDAEREHALEVIERNARVQVQLIEDILDVNRIMTGKLTLDLVRLEPAALVQSAVDVVQIAADAKEVRIEVDIAPDVGVFYGDAGRLQQVFWNLLANGVKFTPSGGRVRVTIERENLEMVIRVADTGRGIEEDFLPHVFERFRQADGSTTRSHGGLGLGLSIVKHVLELHGGRIEAKSDGLGRGSTFTAWLPHATARRGMVTRPPPSALLGRGKLRRPPELEGLRVLVVDDEAEARELIKSILDECRSLTTTAVSAAEAFALVAANPPDVLVSDIGMAIEDGFSLIRRIRALPAARGGKTPAVALTAYARAEDRIRSLMEGFTNHLSKPVEPQQLVMAIAAASQAPVG